MEQAAQGSGGVIIPGGVQKKSRYGILGQAFGGMVVLSELLDLMILEVFSSPNDSMILWFGMTFLNLEMNDSFSPPFYCTGIFDISWEYISIKTQVY